MPKAPTLCDHVAQLRQASRQLVRELGFLESHNPHADATMPQIHALIEIDRHQTLTVAELARLLNLNQSSTCRTLAEMRKLGWVETLALPNDRKRKPMALTQAGLTKLAQINGACDTVYQRALETLDPQERTQVVAAFTRYVEALMAVRSDASCSP